MKKRLWLRVLLILLLLIAVLAGGAAWWIRREIQPLETAFQPQLIRLREAKTAEEMSTLLSERKLLRNPKLLTFWLEWNKKKQVKEGDYEFSPDMSMTQIADILINERFTQNWVTFPEGWTFARMAERIAERGIGDKETFMKLCREPERFKETGFPMPSESLEGYLFPNTYRIPPGSGEEEAIKTLLGGFKTYVYEPYKEEIQQSGFTLHEILTIASMIEKEAFHQKDRPLISAVIHNRLKKRMPLQIDATVLYGMGQWKSRVLYEDLRHPSEYNTYRRQGLPPGPIANMGLASLKAALEPASVDYLFYVAQADGYHRFTETYADHLRAIREIRGKP